MIGIPQFKLSVCVDNGAAVVNVRGELDISSAPEFKRLLTELIDGGTDVITIDVAEMQFIDSNGIHALVTSVARAREHGGTIQLRSPQPNTQKVLEIVGLTEVLPIV